MKKIDFKHLFKLGGGFKNKILKVILLVVLILGVGGLTYAAFTSDFSSNANTITSGVVSMNFSESSSVITLNNALPMNDSEGKVQTNYFDFSITSNLTLNNSDPSEDVNYDIIIEPLAVDTDYTALTNDQIKVYLENKADNSVLVEPTLISSLTDSGSNKILLSTSHTHKYGINTVVTNYRLRVWIDINVDASSWTSSTKLEYKFRININGDADALEKGSLYNVLRDNVNTSVTPNFRYINNYNTNGINTNDSGVFLYNGTDDNAGDKNIYYYRGNVTDNNVVFGGYCWKMIRTTSTGGVKMIYNGEPFTTSDKDLVLIEETDYENLSNDETYPFTFDSTNKTWTSGNYNVNSSTSQISFTIDNPNNKNYYLSYAVSSESNYDKAYFYKDGTEIAVYSGTGISGTIDLGAITSSNIIMVKYSKDGSSYKGTDNVIFSVEAYPDDAKFVTSCNNTGKDSQLSSTTEFNANNTSPAEVGYMYGTIYTFSYKKMTSITNAYYYGKTVTYSDGTYTLNDTTTSTGSNWDTDRTILANGYHYTCFTTNATCETVYYIHYFGASSNAYYLTFTDGDTLETVKTKMFTNTNNSIVKTVIDNWYSTNLSSYSRYLENTIFCNDRSFATGTLGGALSGESVNSTDHSHFATYERMNVTYSPSLTCTNQNDRFSLSVANDGTNNYGNNALTYPVGLITADEVNLAGGTTSDNNNFYLCTGKLYWTLSPYYWTGSYSFGLYLTSTGKFYSDYVSYYRGARPVVSLKSGTAITGGDGSYTNPYIVG